MERLTIETEKGAALKMANNYESEAAARQDLMARYRVAVNRLAGYEDTGLEPEEIEHIVDSYGRGMTLRAEKAERLNLIKDISIDRLRELSQSEHDGRLVVHGRWVNEDFPEKLATVHDMAQCSVCGEFSHKAEHGYAILSKFCPNCGAKMDLE